MIEEYPNLFTLISCNQSTFSSFTSLYLVNMLKMTKCFDFLIRNIIPLSEKLLLRKVFGKNTLMFSITWAFGLLTILSSLVWAYFQSQVHHSDNVLNRSVVNEIQTFRVHAPYRQHLLIPQVYVYKRYFSKFETSLQTGAKLSGNDTHFTRIQP